MEKLTHFLWAKIIAVVLCIVCIFGAFATLLALNYGAKDYGEGELLDDLYWRATNNYSAAIVDSYEKAKDQEKEQALSQFSYTGFKYAVIKNSGIELTESDLRNKENYLYGTPEIAKDYTYHFVSAKEGATGRYEYDTSSLLLGLDMGDFIYYECAVENQEEIIRDVVYAEDTGLFYVVTDEKYLLVWDLTVFDSKDNDGEDSFFCNYSDDLDRPYYIDDANHIVEFTAGGEYRIYLNACDDELSMVLKEGISSDTDVLWQEHEEAGTEVWNNRDIHVISSLPEDADVLRSGYDYISGSVVSYYEHEAEKGTYFHVISYVDTDAICKGDLFYQARQLYHMAELIQRYGILLEVLCVLLAIGCFWFLMYAAGKRKGDGQIHLRIWDRMFFECYTVLALVAEAVLFAGTIWISNKVNLSARTFVLFGLEAGAVAACIAIVYCMGVAVRIKSKNFWKNTLIYRICRWIRQVAQQLGRKFHENPSLIGKTIVVLCVWFLIEFFSMVFFYVLGFHYCGDLLSVIIWLVLSFCVKSVVIITAVLQLDRLKKGASRIAEGDFEHPIDTSRMFWEFKKHGDNLNAVGDGISCAVDKQVKSERFKTELITNVSHDIKTPLTSIINYVDLLEKENIDSLKAKEYIEVLERQSKRLKKLIEDLIEASKASTGNLAVHLEKLEADVFLVQTVGEFEEKTKAAELELIIKKPDEPITVMADSRHFWRVIDNLMSNICKYAQPGTRVYIDLQKCGNDVFITFKNTSKSQLNISGEELMERFVRGDDSRSTEGNGLGLNIAGSLMELMKGELTLVVDGDLFKVTLRFNS